MPRFNESTLIEASAEDVWYLLDDIPEIAASIDGVEHVELLPADEPFDIGSQLHIKTTSLSRLLIAHIVDIDDEAFMMQSHVSVPELVSGDIATQLFPVTAHRSRLSNAGNLRGVDLKTSAALSIGLALFRRKGMQEIGQRVTAFAHAQRESERVR